MTSKLLPYGDRRNSDIVSKIGAHGLGGKLRSRVVRGKIVASVKRTAS